MDKKNSTVMDPVTFIGLLSSKDGMVREKAREELVSRGKSSVPSFIKALKNRKNDQLRWEAAKALGALYDARSIPALVEALEDKNADVAWLAAEALVIFKKAAWQPMLKALIKRGSVSLVLCQGVHHVLKDQKEEGYEESLTILTQTLENGTVPDSVRLAANEMLKLLKTKK